MRRIITSHVAITVLLVVGSSVQAESFNYENMMKARMKLDPVFDFEGTADSYMRVFRPVIFKKYNDDEFQLRAKRRETIELMRNSAERFRLETAFVMRATLTLGEYDFDAQQFPVVESDGSYHWSTRIPRYANDLPERFKIFFYNPELIHAVSMSEAAAREFIRTRKNRYGDVQRNIQTELRFTILEMKNLTDEFYVELQSAKFYADKAGTRVLYEVKKQTEKPVSSNKHIGETSSTSFVSQKLISDGLSALANPKGVIKPAGDHNFDAMVCDQTGLVLVDFYADGCGPCIQQESILEQLASTLKDLTIVKVNVSDSPRVAGKYVISNVPALLLFRGDMVLKSRVGLTNAATIKSWVSAHNQP